MKTFVFQNNYKRLEKKCRQNCSFQEDTQVYLKALFDRIRNFGFNFKKRYRK